MPVKTLFGHQQNAPARGFWLIALVLALCWSGPCDAQVMGFRVQVDDYFLVHDLRPIAPVNSSAGAGWQILGDKEKATSGRFTVGAAENTWILVSVEAPEALVLDAGNQLPFRLKLSYQHKSTADTIPWLAPFKGDSEDIISLSGSGLLVESMLNPMLPLETEVVLHPSVYLGQVKDGVYRGRINVRLEYF